MQFLLHRVFQKRFEKLPLKIREQFFERAEIFCKDTYAEILQNHSVDNVYPNCRSINITGDVRALYKVQGNIAIFVNIGTHSELY